MAFVAIVRLIYYDLEVDERTGLRVRSGEERMRLADFKEHMAMCLEDMITIEIVGMEYCDEYGKFFDVSSKEDKKPVTVAVTAENGIELLVEV